MLEDELKFDVAESFVLPKIKGLVPRKSKALTATYFDTSDLRLARAGATLRYRVGDEEPWTVKLPTGTPGVRHEISLAAPQGRPPADLVWLVCSLTRGAALRKVAVIQSDRRVYDLTDRQGRVWGELADDRVTSGEVSFREIEIEGGTGDERSIVESALIGAGARPGAFPSKLVRVLGPAAQPETEAVPDKKGAGAVVTEAVRRGVRRILEHDPLVRLGEPLPDGDTAVHQMRVGCRRLRSDLKTFAALLDRDWTGRLRAELRWLAELLGAARDAEVLRARLVRTAEQDPLAPMDREAVAAIAAALEDRQARALESLRRGMRTRRYLALVEALGEAARSVPLTKRARRPLVAPSVSGLTDKASTLTMESPDEQWHEVRILTKRARYAAEAVNRRGKLARSLAAMQDLLGEHQDAAVAAEIWLSFGDEPGLAVTAGRLHERERAAIRRVRAEFLTTRFFGAQRGTPSAAQIIRCANK
ncbi:CYTH and CHAD domain-containing protein [Allorhizocola rhizosphaerae]|uniref:CYTH and CHAD domain-containing protein n=1 Tax=Allorhizocola rhizosphaerae TaxID=1872709 RepID=UPI000E3B589A|nr:CYTH and CHAD domain-containing protein [Allorhizocola rhizosphaerae]